MQKREVRVFSGISFRHLLHGVNQLFSLRRGVVRILKGDQELDDCLRSMKPTRRRREVVVATAPEFTLSLYCDL
jgi:hypothetical protein